MKKELIQKYLPKGTQATIHDAVAMFEISEKDLLQTCADLVYQGLHLKIITATDERKELDALTQKLAQSIGLSGISSYVLPVQSVGVQGDQRSYRHPAVIAGTKDIQKVICSPANIDKIGIFSFQGEIETTGVNL